MVPSDAVVADQFGDLGAARTPLRLRSADVYRQGDVRLTFRADGYQTATQSVSHAYFTTSTTYPAEGAVTLRPVSLSARLRAWRWPLAGATAIVAVAVGALALARRRMREAQNLADLVLAPASADQPAALSGTVGPYLIIDRLGAGAMATVYRAVPVDDPEGTPVALKVVNEVTASSADFVGRFRREIDLYRRLSHPNIVRVCGWGEHGGLLYVALEVIEGGTLYDHLSSDGLPPDRALAFLSPLFRAVHHAHTQGVVHRDLKPENVMITRGGVVKVTDFGLGRALDSVRLTRSDGLLGTPAYMSPEQVLAAQTDPSMDQYALGVMAYEMVCGRLPFEGADAMQVAMMHLESEPPPPSRLRREVPAEVETVLLKMLSKSAVDRYANVEAAEQALTRALRAWAGGLG